MSDGEDSNERYVAGFFFFPEAAQAARSLASDLENQKFVIADLSDISEQADRPLWRVRACKALTHDELWYWDGQFHQRHAEYDGHDLDVHPVGHALSEWPTSAPT